MERKLNLRSILEFGVAFVWLFLGATFFLIPMISIGARASDLSLMEYLENQDLIQIHSTVCSCVGHLLGISLFAILFTQLIKSDLISFKKNWLKYILIIVIGFGVLYGLTILMNYIYSLFGFGEDDTSANQELIIKILNSDAKLYMIIYSGILAPIFEEIVFRKLFYKALKENTKLPCWAIVLIISVVFALIHVTDKASLVYFPQYFVLALIITASYAISKENLFVSTGLHFLNNLLAILEILL